MQGVYSASTELFQTSLLRRLIMELQPGEELHIDQAANLKRGFEYVGGKLYVTNKRLYFKAHPLTYRNARWRLI